jgi:drug/metabolite transporter (DMT)-like permease
MNHVSPAKVSTYAYINPILAIALGSWLAGEHLPTNGLVGAAAILAGVALANFSTARRSRARP